MHPVVIMSYDKSPAITKAVAALEEAGMEVIVLNTKTAKLVQFLGALAGETDDEEEDKDQDEETPPADEPTDEPPADEPPAPPEEVAVEESMEVVVNGETMTAVIVEGAGVELSSPVAQSGGKITYVLRESEFSFWGDGQNVPIEISFEGKVPSTVQAVLKNGEPSLRIGRDWLKAHQA